jgi:hypothetical protein
MQELFCVDFRALIFFVFVNSNRAAGKHVYIGIELLTTELLIHNKQQLSVCEARKFLSVRL